MTYLLQIIVFILALIGIFFKSTQTNEKGETLTSERGLPYLTSAGQIVVLLLSVSFIISLITIWTSSQSDKNKDNELKKLQEQNTALNEDIKKLRAPIKNILMTFNIEIPLTHNDLKDYRNRLIKDTEKKEEYEFVFRENYPLFPEKDIDYDAYTFLNSTKLEINIFKRKIDPQTYNKSETPDIYFSLITYFKEDEDLPEEATYIKEGALVYRSFFLDKIDMQANDLPIKISKQSGNIVAVQELSDAQVIFSAEPWDLSTLTGFYDKEAKLQSLKLNVSDGRYFRCQNIKKIQKSGGNTFYFCTLKEEK